MRYQMKAPEKGDSTALSVHAEEAMPSGFLSLSAHAEEAMFY